MIKKILIFFLMFNFKNIKLSNSIDLVNNIVEKIEEKYQFIFDKNLNLNKKNKSYLEKFLKIYKFKNKFINNKYKKEIFEIKPKL